MNSISSFTLSSAVYALIPVIILINGIDATDTTALVLLCMVAFSFLFIAPSLLKRHYRKAVLNFHLIALSFFGGLMFLGFVFFTSLSVNNGNPYFNLIIIESWPIFSAILFPVFKIGKTKNFQIFDYALALLAVFGVILVSFDSFQTAFYKKIQLNTIIYPFVAMAMMGMASTFKAKYVQECQVKFGIGPYNSFFLKYLQLTPLLILISPFLYLQIATKETPHTIAIVIALLNIASAITFSFGTLKIKRSTDLFIWFFTPVFSIFYFSIIDKSLPSPIQISGIAVIIACNLLASLENKERFAYRGGVISLTLVGSLCVVIPPRDMLLYYDALTVLGIFSTILLAFLLERTSSRTYHEIELYSRIRTDLAKTGNQDFVEQLSGAFRCKNEIKFKRLVRKIPIAGSGSEAIHLLGMLATSRKVGIKISNLFSLVICSFAITILSISSRPDGWQHDLVVTSFVPSIFYGLFYIIDLDRQRYFIPYSTYRVGECDRVTFSQRLSQTDLQQSVWSVILIVVLFIAFTISFATNHT